MKCKRWIFKFQKNNIALEDVDSNKKHVTVQISQYLEKQYLKRNDINKKGCIPLILVVQVVLVVQVFHSFQVHQLILVYHLNQVGHLVPVKKKKDLNGFTNMVRLKLLKK